MHKSRLGALIIDHGTDDLECEAEFWSAARDGSVHCEDETRRYIERCGDPAEPRVILQRVEHPSRVHIDIESVDIEAVEAPGAGVVEKMPRWTVIEAPSGHRYYRVTASRDGFEGRANARD